MSKIKIVTDSSLTIEPELVEKAKFVYNKLKEKDTMLKFLR